MATCPHCDSINVHSRGTRTRTRFNSKVNRYKCMSCRKWFCMSGQSSILKFGADESLVGQFDKFVITGVVKFAELNTEFYESLKTYCKLQNAKVILVPINSKPNGEPVHEWAINDEDLYTSSIQLANKLKLMANLNISPAIENPLGGLESVSKGDSIIIAHSTLQMRTVAVNVTDSPAMLHTTGVVTLPNYTNTKTGIKAAFNHSASALVVEVDDDINGFHIRVLNADDNGAFYDISGYYNGQDFTPLEYVEALIAGDTHVAQHDPMNADAMYYRDDSMINVLKPRKLILHDLLDMRAENHHDCDDPFLQFGKSISKTNLIEEELINTIDHVVGICPPNVEVLVVASNHIDHLYRYLKDVLKPDSDNAKIYHQLKFMMFTEIQATGKVPDPFALWSKYYIETKYDEATVPKITFLERGDSYKIHGIEISNHGDKGVNGSRATAVGMSKLAFKQVIGHSHSPKIHHGCFQTGTSSLLKLGYNAGAPSSWMHTHCVIYPNGKRQLLSVLDDKLGKWKK
jgi:hypothetical protein